MPKGHAPAAGTWWVVFLDDSDQAGALTYHDLTNDGLPISKVFVKTLLADHASVSVGATHELCEMAVDPWLNSADQDPHGVFWAGEICDPVEDDQYGYQIGGILVTDFVTPNWFTHQHAQGAIDFKGHAQKAFEVLTGGYAQKWDPHHGWQQVTGSKAMHSQRATASRSAPDAPFTACPPDEGPAGVETKRPLTSMTSCGGRTKPRGGRCGDRGPNALLMERSHGGS